MSTRATRKGPICHGTKKATGSCYINGYYMGNSPSKGSTRKLARSCMRAAARKSQYSNPRRASQFWNSTRGFQLLAQSFDFWKQKALHEKKVKRHRKLFAR